MCGWCMSSQLMVWRTGNGIFLHQRRMTFSWVLIHSWCLKQLLGPTKPGHLSIVWHIQYLPQMCPPGQDLGIEDLALWPWTWTPYRGNQVRDNNTVTHRRLLTCRRVWQSTCCGRRRCRTVATSCASAAAAVDSRPACWHSHPLLPHRCNNKDAQ